MTDGGREKGGCAFAASFFVAFIAQADIAQAQNVAAIGAHPPLQFPRALEVGHRLASFACYTQKPQKTLLVFFRKLQNAVKSAILIKKEESPWI